MKKREKKIITKPTSNNILLSILTILWSVYYTVYFCQKKFLDEKSVFAVSFFINDFVIFTTIICHDSIIKFYSLWQKNRNFVHFYSIWTLEWFNSKWEKKTQQKQILRIQKAISTYTYKYPNYMCYDKEYKEKGTEQHFLVCHQLFTRNNTQKKLLSSKKREEIVL